MASAALGARPGGFSLLELVIVILLVGILSVVALPKVLDRGTFDERGYLDETLAALRYAQKLAIATGCEVQASLAGGGYDLKQRAGCTGAGGFTVVVDHPARSGGFAAAPPAGVAVGGTLSVYFDKIGRPHAPGGALLGAPASATIGTRSVTVEPQTGFVHP